MNAKQCLNHGGEFPYDAPDSFWENSNNTPPKATDKAHATARGIIADLEDRHTIKHGFADVDEATRVEIVNDLAEIIREGMKESAK